MMTNIHQPPTSSADPYHTMLAKDNSNLSHRVSQMTQFNQEGRRDQFFNMYGMVGNMSMICEVRQIQSMSQDKNIFASQKSSNQNDEFICRRRGRAILTSDQAREIFISKPKDKTSFSAERAIAAFLSKKFGVSVKTVRDIWIGRTWYRATFHLDPSKPVAAERLQRQPGRPKGAKDRQPRTRKLDKCEGDKGDKLSRAGSTSPAKSESDDIYSGKEIGATTSRIEIPTAAPYPQPDCPDSFNQHHINGRDTKGIACCDEEAGTWDRNSLPVFDQRHQNTHDATPATPQIYPPHLRSPATAECQWHSPLASSLSMEEFADPFHDDWPFWPKVGSSCHADYAPEGSNCYIWAKNQPAPATHGCQPGPFTPVPSWGGASYPEAADSSLRSPGLPNIGEVFTTLNGRCAQAVGVASAFNEK